MTELEGVDQGSGDQGKINPAEGGIADDLTWLGRGFFQPLYNLQFYRAAVGKSLVEAIIFFVAFATLLTIITTLNLTRELGAVSDDIEQAFASGAFPDLVIENGLATGQTSGAAINRVAASGCAVAAHVKTCLMPAPVLL